MNDLLRPDIKRLLAAINKQKYDRVPNFEIWLGQRCIDYFFKTTGYPNHFWDMPPEDAVKLVNLIGQDAIVCSLTPELPPDGSLLTFADTAKIKRQIDAGAIKSKLQTYIDAVSQTDIGVIARIGGPLTQTYMSCGPIPIQSFMLLLYDEPEMLAELMKVYTELSLQIIDSIKDMPFELFYIGDDLCANCGPMISPEQIEKVWAPYYEKIINAAHATGRPVICHCCGDQTPVIPYFLKWHVKACHPLQSGANDIYKFKELYGKKLTPIGNISVGLLSAGSREEVIADTKMHLEKLGSDGAYVLCSDHSIIDSVKPENFHAMIELAHKAVF